MKKKTNVDDAISHWNLNVRKEGEPKMDRTSFGIEFFGEDAHPLTIAGKISKMEAGLRDLRNDEILRIHKITGYPLEKIQSDVPDSND